MQTFKVGDWIVEPNGNKVRLNEVPEPGSYYAEDCVLWQPLPNEWCWFWDHEDSLILLQKFVKHDVKNTFRATDLAGFEFNYAHCEPFIGQLPNFLKEHK